MKVLMIISGFPNEKNPAKGIFNWKAYKLLSAHHEVDVIQIRFLTPLRKIYEVSEYEGVKVMVFNIAPIILKNMRWLPLLCSIFRLFSRRVRKKYEIVHSVGLGMTALLGTIIAEKNNARHVVQVIGTDVNEELPKYHKTLKYYFSKRIHAIGANSKMLICSVENHLPVPVKKVIYRGVNIGDFRFTDGKAREKIIVFLGGFYTSHNIPEEPYNMKGGVDLMKVWQRNEDFFITHGYSMYLAGPNSSSAFVQKWKNGLSDPNKVNLLGVINQQKVKELLQKADLVMLPSHAEGLPNVAMEAMASGAIVLASAVGGIPELIQDGYNGYLFEMHNLEQIEHAMKYAICLPEDRKEALRSKARKTVEEQFNSKNFAIKYTELYNSLSAQ